MAAAKKKIIDPLRPMDFGLEMHKVRKFNANVSGKLSVEELEAPELWVNVAVQLEAGSEVRCLADDMSFVAYGMCTFAQGTTAKIKIMEMFELDEVDHDSLADEASDYEAKLCGSKKWCVRKKSTGEIVKEGLPTQLEAMRELEDYKKALRS